MVFLLYFLCEHLESRTPERFDRKIRGFSLRLVHKHGVERRKTSVGFMNAEHRWERTGSEVKFPQEVPLKK